MEIRKTDIYNIDEQLVVADTIEKAIALYKEFKKGKDIISVTLKDVDVIVSYEEPFDLKLDLSGKEEDVSSNI